MLRQSLEAMHPHGAGDTELTLPRERRKLPRWMLVGVNSVVLLSAALLVVMTAHGIDHINAQQ